LWDGAEAVSGGLSGSDKSHAYIGISVALIAFFAPEDIEISTFSIDDATTADHALSSFRRAFGIDKAAQVADKIGAKEVPDPFGTFPSYS
jgi:hypothetical protein